MGEGVVIEVVTGPGTGAFCVFEPGGAFSGEEGVSGFAEAEVGGGYNVIEFGFDALVGVEVMDAVSDRFGEVEVVFGLDLW